MSPLGKVCLAVTGVCWAIGWLGFDAPLEGLATGVIVCGAWILALYEVGSDEG